jgi:hypothetical protein
VKLFNESGSDLHVEQTTLDWIRAHAPRQFASIRFATLHNARVIAAIGVGLLAISMLATALLLSVVREHTELVSPFRYTVLGVIAGIGIGGSIQLLAQARWLRLISRIKGEGIGGARRGSTPDPAAE